jgi:hypothetical protein
MEFKVFGNTADQIEEGQLFIAHVDSVEGHKRVTLESV